MITLRLFDKYPFTEPEIKRIEIRDDGKTVLNFIPHGWTLDNCRLSVNNKAAKPLTSVNDGDEVDIYLIPSAPLAIPLTISTLFTWYIPIFAAGALISWAVGTVINWILGPQQNPGKRGDRESPTYSWDGIETNYSSGGPIPVVYGEHRVGGQVISVFSRANTDGEDTLYLLLSLCHGPIQEIGGYTTDQDDLEDATLPTGMYINGNPISTFKGVKVSLRMGTLDQTPIQGFDDIVVPVTVGATLEPDEPYTYETKQPIEAFEINFNHPRGLYKINNQGDISHWNVGYSVEYRLKGGTWSIAEDVVVRKKLTTSFDTTYRKDNLTRGVYEIRVTKSSEWENDEEHFNEFIWTEVNEIQYDDIAFSGLALVAIKALATDQLSGRVPTIITTIKGKTVLVWDGISETTPSFVEQYSNNPAWVSFDINTNEVYGLGAYKDIRRDMDVASLKGFADYCDELVYDASGKQTTIDADSASGQKVLNVASTDNWEAGDTVYIDYGGDNEETGVIDTIQDGVSLTLVSNLTNTHTAADADAVDSRHKRHVFDGVFDSAISGWDATMRVCQVGRGIPVMAGSKMKIAWERARAISHVFGMDNIVAGSLKISRVGITKRSNSIEIQFLNADAGYETDIVNYEDPSLYDNDEPLKPKSYQMYGITSPARAYREAKFRANVERLSTMIEFETGIEALPCEPGDVFGFAHDLPQWGISGRCQLAGTTSSIKLDRSITMAGATVYEVMVQHVADGTIETKVLATVAGTHTAGTSLALDTGQTFTLAPAPGDTYSFGVQNISVKPFILVSASLNMDMHRVIRGVEYDADIYDDDFGDLEEDDYTNYPDPDRIPDNVTDLTLSVANVVQSGATLHYIRVGFNFADVSLSPHPSMIWWREASEVGWTLAGTTYQNSYLIETNFEPGITYQVSVTPLSRTGNRKHPDDGTIGSIAIDARFPDDVTGLAVIRPVGNFIIATWNHIDMATNPDFSHYEVRRGAAWTHGTIVGTTQDNTFSTDKWDYSGLPETWFVRAVTYGGLMSLIPCEYTYTAGNHISPANAIEATQDQYNEFAGLWPGTKTNLVMNASGYLVLDTGQTTGTYTSTVRDVLSTEAAYHLNLCCQVTQYDNTEIDDMDMLGNSYAAGMRDFHGPFYVPPTSYLLEFRVADNSLTWGDWLIYKDSGYPSPSAGTPGFRYVQYRATITTTDATYQPILQRLIATMEI